MSKEFIVHLRNDGTDWKEYKHMFRYRGATIIIRPVDKNTSMFRYSLCHKGDMFCRKTGVAKAREKPPVEVNNKNIPQEIARVRSYFFHPIVVTPLDGEAPEPEIRISYNDILLGFKYLASRRAV